MGFMKMMKKEFKLDDFLMIIVVQWTLGVYVFA